jgi:hypothetical protein
LKVAATFLLKVKLGDRLLFPNVGVTLGPAAVDTLAVAGYTQLLLILISPGKPVLFYLYNADTVSK